jgi:chaperonin GroES
MVTQKQHAKKMVIVPLADRVLVRPSDTQEQSKTASGIYIPETVNRERPQQGMVIAVGEGRITDEGKRLPMSVKKGDTIVFSKYDPDEIKVDGEEYYIIGEASILAVLK